MTIIRHTQPDSSSALFRAKNPRSWWWDPQTDFLAAILHASTVGNWQRGGGKGRQPKVAKRPVERARPAATGNAVGPKSITEFNERRERARAEGGLKLPKNL